MKNKSIHKIFIVILICAFVVTITYKQWESTPRMAIENLYISGYSGKDPEAIAFSDVINQYKNSHYSKPQVRWKYSNGVWQAFVDFYLYSEKDGSVEDIKVLWVSFKTNREMKYLFRPRIVDVTEFKEVD